MSPEQASGGRVVVDHRSDVYSLGVTLYELITGHPAFDGDDRLELIRRIGGEEPRPPRRVAPGIPRDLETIVLKAMAREPVERYAAALDLAEDLGRFLGGRAILARPPGAIDLAAKWARRNRSAVTAAILLTVVAASGLAGAILWRDALLRRHNDELEAALERAERHEASTRRLLYDSRIRMAQQSWSDGQLGFAEELLGAARPEPGQPDLRGFEWHYLRRAWHADVSVLADREATAMLVTPDGRTLISGDRSGTLTLLDLAEGRERARFRAHSRWTSGLRISDDGRTLATWSTEVGRPSEVRLWDAEGARPLACIPGIEGHIVALELSRDGRRLIMMEHGLSGDGAGDRAISWDLTRGPDRPAPGPPPIACDRMACSPDGRWLATAMKGGRAVTLWDAATGRPMRVLTRRLAGIENVAFSPDGQILVAYTPGITIWETHSGREIGTLPYLEWIAHAFSPDNDHLAGLTVDRRTVELVKGLKSEPREVLLPKSPGRNLQMAFSPDGGRLAGGGGDMPLTLWDTSSGSRLATFPGKAGDLGCLAFPPQYGSLIFSGDDRRLHAWHYSRPPVPVDRFEGHQAEVWGLAFSPDNRTLITSADDHSIGLWDPLDGGRRAELKGHDSLVAAVAVGPDGTRLASASFDRTVRIWDLPGGRLLRVLAGHADRVRAVAFSPDGRRVASAGSDRTVRVWDLERGEPARVFEGHRDTVRALAFHPGSGLLVSAGNDRAIRGVDVEAGREVFTLAGPRNYSALAFSPDGSLLASGDDAGGVAVWDFAARSRRWSYKGADAEVRSLAFSPDGRSLAGARGESDVHLFDPITGQVLLGLQGHSKRVNALAFAPDGRSLASASDDGEVRIWRAGPP